MNKRYKFSLVFLYIISLFVAAPLVGAAEETGSASEEMTESGSTFSYEVIQPENQVDSSVGYYNLKLSPGQEQTVQIRLTNPSAVEVAIEVALNGAVTNGGGVIEYGPNKIDNDASLRFPFEEVVSAPEEVVLAPGEEKMLDLVIKMPETSFEGYISGGIRLMRKGQEEETDTMVVNKIAYLVGMLLTQQESTDIENIPEDMQFNKVYPATSNYRSAFMINFSNIQPIYVDDMTVEVQITKEGSEAVLYDTKKSQMRMAPNTMIDFPVELNGEAMVPGDYRAKITVKSGKGGLWEWDEAFTVTDEEAEKFNAQDLTLVQEPGLNWQLIAMIAGGVLGVLLVIFLIVHFARKKKVGKKKSKQMKNKKKTEKKK
ncbi:DUF916 and DUF3324 domain-containing protein [uncultured Enterococcus sp.]|uniref:DUF916 and DUF3324 domain-containing protein n=1 Tax=uncultured Enterococcus sp. TaxID=167972 RepID=UPI002AA72ECC|nr:DUF916 and DUF3324 domain-containing protein [uncultured Enterococcus sp.]